MSSQRRSSLYAAALIISLAVGIAMRDMPVGLLLAVVLLLAVGGLNRRR